MENQPFYVFIHHPASTERQHVNVTATGGKAQKVEVDVVPKNQAKPIEGLPDEATQAALVEAFGRKAKFEFTPSL